MRIAVGPVGNGAKDRASNAMFVADLGDRCTLHFNCQCLGKTYQQIGRGRCVANELVTAHNQAMMDGRIDDPKSRLNCTPCWATRFTAQKLSGCTFEFSAKTRLGCKLDAAQQRHFMTRIEWPRIQIMLRQSTGYDDVSDPALVGEATRQACKNQFIHVELPDQGDGGHSRGHLADAGQYHHARLLLVIANVIVTHADGAATVARQALHGADKVGNFLMHGADDA